MKPMVYILVLNWNGWKDTINCVESLKSLSYPNYQIVVLDNASNDDSVAQIRRAHPDITLIETGANLGFAGGNNVGIRYALDRGADFVWLLNNDTKVDSNALTAMIALAESDPKIGLVGSVLYYMNEPKQVQAWGGGCINFWLGTSRHIKSESQSDNCFFLTGASLLIRREVLDQTGLLDESFFMYWEDSDLCFRARKLGWRLGVAADSRVLHKESASVGKRSPRLDMYFNASAVKFFRRHAPLPFFPIVLGVGGRLLKRILKGEWERVWAVLKGVSSS